MARLGLEAVRLAPDSRKLTLDDLYTRVQRGLGVDVKTDVLPLLQGTVAYSTNVFAILPDYLDFKGGPRRHGETNALRCERNLMQIGTALELYAVEPPWALSRGVCRCWCQGIWQGNSPCLPGRPWGYVQRFLPRRRGSGVL